MFIPTKYISSGTDAGLGENKSMTRIKEHPSYKPVCVRPVRKPHCWFSHKTAQLLRQLKHWLVKIIKNKGFVKIFKHTVTRDDLLITPWGVYYI